MPKPNRLQQADVPLDPPAEVLRQTKADMDRNIESSYQALKLDLIEVLNELNFLGFELTEEKCAEVFFDYTFYGVLIGFIIQTPIEAEGVTPEEIMEGIINAIEDSEIQELMESSYHDILSGNMYVALDTIRDLIGIMETRMQQNEMEFAGEGASELYIEDGQSVHSSWGYEPEEDGDEDGGDRLGTEDTVQTSGTNQQDESDDSSECCKPFTRQSARRQAPQQGKKHLQTNGALQSSSTSESLHHTDSYDEEEYYQDEDGEEVNVAGPSAQRVKMASPHTRSHSSSFEPRPSEENSSAGIDEDTYDGDGDGGGFDSMESFGESSSDGYHPVPLTRQGLRRKDPTYSDDHSNTDPCPVPAHNQANSEGLGESLDPNGSEGVEAAGHGEDESDGDKILICTRRIRDPTGLCLAEQENPLSISGTLSSGENDHSLRDTLKTTVGGSLGGSRNININVNTDTNNMNRGYNMEDVSDSDDEGLVRTTRVTAPAYRNGNEGMSPGLLLSSGDGEDTDVDPQRTMRFQQDGARFDDRTKYVLSDSDRDDTGVRAGGESKVARELAGASALIASIEQDSLSPAIGDRLALYDLTQRQKEKLFECTSKLTDMRNTLENRERETQMMKDEVRRLRRTVEELQLGKGEQEERAGELEKKVDTLNKRLEAKEQMLSQYRQAARTQTQEDIQKIEKKLDDGVKSGYYNPLQFITMTPTALGTGVEGNSTPVIDSTFFLQSPKATDANDVSQEGQAGDGAYKTKYEKLKKEVAAMSGCLQQIHNVANGGDVGGGGSLRRLKHTKKALGNLAEMVKVYYQMSRRQLEAAQQKLVQERMQHQQEREEWEEREEREKAERAEQEEREERERKERDKRERERKAAEDALALANRPLSSGSKVKSKELSDEGSKRSPMAIPQRFDGMKTIGSPSTRLKTAAAGARRGEPREGDKDKDKETLFNQQLANRVGQFNNKMREKEKQDFHNMALSVKCILMNNGVQIRLLTNEIWTELEKNHVRRAEWIAYVEARIMEEFGELQKQKQLELSARRKAEEEEEREREKNKKGRGKGKKRK